jgi:L-ornithine Nalpha-acyltransferase
MHSFRCIIARTMREITDAQRLRYRVYSEEEGLLPASAGASGREIDALDYADTTVHLLVYAGQDPVGTVRLLQPSAEASRRGRVGLDLESKVDLGALAAPGILPAEVTRFCVLRPYRRTGVTTALFQGLHAESVRRGVTHWVAGANMETDCAEDAALAYRVAHEKRLVSDRFRAEPRAHEPPQTPRKRPCYTEEQRQRARAGELAGLDLPRTLALFATRMSARFIGPPVYDGYFNVFALPLVAALAEVVARRASPGALEEQTRSRVEAPV